MNKNLHSKTFELKLISVFEVSKLIDQLQVNKSSGVDGISPKIPKLCKDIYCQ